VKQRDINLANATATHEVPPRTVSQVDSVGRRLQVVDVVGERTAPDVCPVEHPLRRELPHTPPARSQVARG
jgi:hypothetical protein